MFSEKVHKSIFMNNLNGQTCSSSTNRFVCGHNIQITRKCIWLGEQMSSTIREQQCARCFILTNSPVHTQLPNAETHKPMGINWRLNLWTRPRDLGLARNAEPLFPLSFFLAAGTLEHEHCSMNTATDVSSLEV